MIHSPVELYKEVSWRDLIKFLWKSLYRWWQRQRQQKAFKKLGKWLFSYDVPLAVLWMSENMGGFSVFPLVCRWKDQVLKGPWVAGGRDSRWGGAQLGVRTFPSTPLGSWDLVSEIFCSLKTYWRSQRTYVSHISTLPHQKLMLRNLKIFHSFKQQ